MLEGKKKKRERLKTIPPKEALSLKEKRGDLSPPRDGFPKEGLELVPKKPPL